MASLNYGFGIKKTRSEISLDLGTLELKSWRNFGTNFQLYHLLADIPGPGLSLSVPRFPFLLKAT